MLNRRQAAADRHEEEAYSLSGGPDGGFIGFGPHEERRAGRKKRAKTHGEDEGYATRSSPSKEPPDDSAAVAKPR